MPATPLNAAERYSALDGLEIVFLPVIAASTLIATRAEINAGTDLSTEVAEWSGFTTTSETIETPDLTRFTGKIAGRVTAEDSSLSIYADRGADDVRDVMPRDTLGYLAFMDSGDTPTEKMDVYPIQVLSCEKVRSMEAATMLRVDVSMTRIPVYDITIPAAV